MPELVVGSQLTGGSGYRIDYALVGYLTQLLYDYRNKYFERRVKKSNEPEKRLLNREKSMPTLKFRFVSHFRFGVAIRSDTNAFSPKLETIE